VLGVWSVVGEEESIAARSLDEGRVGFRPLVREDCVLIAERDIHWVRAYGVVGIFTLFYGSIFFGLVGGWVDIVKSFFDTFLLCFFFIIWLFFLFGFLVGGLRIVGKRREVGTAGVLVLWISSSYQFFSFFRYLLGFYSCCVLFLFIDFSFVFCSRWIGSGWHLWNYSFIIINFIFGKHTTWHDPESGRKGKTCFITIFTMFHALISRLGPTAGP
jgi:hypothetical protein